jgi:hypothetical protein
MRWPRGSCLLLLSALWLSAPATVRAGDAANGRVLLIEQGRDPFLEQVGAEVEKLGFTLVRSDASGPLEAAARAEGALCAIRVLPSRTGVEVWMADATSGRSLLRQVVVDERPGGPDRDLIALQTAELLRTSLLGESASSEAPQPQPAPAQTATAGTQTPDETAATKSGAAQRRSTGVQVAAGALYSPGGADAAVELGVSLQHFFSERWGLGLDLSLPIGAATLSGIEGSAQLDPYFSGLAFLGRLSQRASPFFASAGVGFSILYITFDGKTQDPLRSGSGHKLMEAFYLRADAGFELVAWLRLGVRVLGGASLQHLAFAFAGNDAGSFGPILLAGFGFVELALP